MSLAIDSLSERIVFFAKINIFSFVFKIEFYKICMYERN